MLEAVTDGDRRPHVVFAFYWSTNLSNSDINSGKLSTARLVEQLKLTNERLERLEAEIRHATGLRDEADHCHPTREDALMEA